MLWRIPELRKKRHIWRSYIGEDSPGNFRTPTIHALRLTFLFKLWKSRNLWESLFQHQKWFRCYPNHFQCPFFSCINCKCIDRVFIGLQNTLGYNSHVTSRYRTRNFLTPENYGVTKFAHHMGFPLQSRQPCSSVIYVAWIGRHLCSPLYYQRTCCLPFEWRGSEWKHQRLICQKSKNISCCDKLQYFIHEEASLEEHFFLNKLIVNKSFVCHLMCTWLSTYILVHGPPPDVVLE